ncbi:hypothetical protein VTN02DRAFT_182 [Thermoascus thermophilus]
MGKLVEVVGKVVDLPGGQVSDASFSLPRVSVSVSWRRSIGEVRRIAITRSTSKSSKLRTGIRRFSTIQTSKKNKKKEKKKTERKSPGAGTVGRKRTYAVVRLRCFLRLCERCTHRNGASSRLVSSRRGMLTMGDTETEEKREAEGRKRKMKKTLKILKIPRPSVVNQTEAGLHWARMVLWESRAEVHESVGRLHNDRILGTRQIVFCQVRCLYYIIPQA